MKNKLRIIAAGAALTMLAATSPAAWAGSDIGFSITIGNIGAPSARIVVPTRAYRYAPPVVYYPRQVAYAYPRIAYRSAQKWHPRRDRHSARSHDHGREWR